MIKKLYKKYRNKTVVKNFFFVAGTSFILQPITVIKGFVVANVLGPADYGILKTVELVQMLNKFGNLGFKSVANREISNAIGEKNEEDARLIRNTNYTAEFFLATLLFLIGVFSTFFIEGTKVSILIALASLSLYISKLEALMRTEAAIQKDFKLLSRVKLYSGLLLAVLIMILVNFLKIYAIFLVNILVFSIGFYLLRKNLNFPYKFEIDKKTFIRSVRIGIPLSFVTLSLGLYKYSERLLLVDFIDEVALGLFSFALMVSNAFSIFFKVSIKVRLQDIWILMGAKEYKVVNKMVIRESLILTLLSLIIVPIIWLVTDFAVPYFLPKYEEAIPIVRITTLVIPFEVIANYASAVVISKRVNDLKTPVILRITSLIIFVGGAYYYFINDELTLMIYAYLNLLGYAVFNIGMLVKYYISFKRIYLRINA